MRAQQRRRSRSNTLPCIWRMSINYYLQEREQVEQYLAERKSQAEEVRRLNEAKFNTQGLRERLLARQPKVA